ncbi:nucleoside-diphosphate-sugar epimerase [Cryptococcus wingfieldii CBS 7118]|uniref:Nucleoside-diphosphate-sugar epimerase n=1 Tax=Cryptococcus wingfieldii CBS 7118 TaxID=1295528 RepID=A0A1E3JEX3_9TREE|nr:nucleoside-diphosphate-sugar epimerase [Cryptococcus wingfieldii CBS 7118]ODN99430.1 nucleoside-diphosphate-sugar epimerase [Cryptococcus wingfieldii CBS 7118]
MTAINGNGVTEKNVVLITGAGGWLGGILANALQSDPRTPNVHLILADIVKPKLPNSPKNALSITADLTTKEGVDALFQTEFGVPDTVYCFHGIMSRGSEDNFELGLKVNIDSIRLMLDSARHHKPSSGQPIKFVFTSSLAVYGGPLPAVVDINTIATPEGAYGMGKLSSELLVNEYTRRGFVDGRILRLPTIVVRPGPPSAATSAFISGIIREPLHGVKAICPVGDSLESKELELAAWVASPETTIKNFVIAKHIPAEKFLPHTRVAYLPGFTVTVREELEALAQVAGKQALDLVTFQDDPINRRIVGSWPARFDNAYPRSLGFVVDEGGMVPVVQRFKEAVAAGLV